MREALGIRGICPVSCVRAVVDCVAVGDVSLSTRNGHWFVLKGDIENARNPEFPFDLWVESEQRYIEANIEGSCRWFFMVFVKKRVGWRGESISAALAADVFVVTPEWESRAYLEVYGSADNWVMPETLI